MFQKISDWYVTTIVMGKYKEARHRHQTGGPRDEYVPTVKQRLKAAALILVSLILGLIAVIATICIAVSLLGPGGFFLVVALAGLFAIIYFIFLGRF